MLLLLLLSFRSEVDGLCVYKNKERKRRRAESKSMVCRRASDATFPQKGAGSLAGSLALNFLAVFFMIPSSHGTSKQGQNSCCL